MSILRRRALIEQGSSMPYWYNIDEDWDYIIDQTGKYENPIIVNENNLYDIRLRSIANIRDLSKLVVGYYDETSAKLIWSPIDNSSKTIVKCNTPAYPININVSKYISEHPTADVFMKLPEFWWRCWDVNDNPDTVAFKFVTEEPTDGNTWFHWDGNIFIGVYKGHIDEINNVKLLRSISGASISREVLSTFKTSSRNKGAGYRCISYEVHQIMALLFFGLYGKANDEEVCYDYFDAPYNTTGITDVVGIEEDRSYQITDCFWGFENWLIADNSDLEIIENLYTTYNSTRQSLCLNDINGVGIRYIDCRRVLQSSPLKLILGANADLIIKERDFNEKFLFYGDSEVSNVAQRYAIRGSHITGLMTLADKNTPYYSRLQYEGNNEQNTTPSSATSVVSSYVLDQTDPNGNPDTAIVFDNDNSVILAIKAASDFYACENKDWGNNTPEFIKMSKTNKLKTIHGTTLDANNYDIFMKLPEFWWKYEIVDNNEDKVRFSFTMTNPNDDTWHHWEGDTFIGVYEGYVDNDRAYSRSGVITSSVSEGMLKIYTSNRGTGFKNINYDIHRIMCILGWGYLANLNYKLGPGRESKNYGITVNNNTGVNDTLGFTDNTYTGINNAINFWGLEDWWGHETELLDDILFMQSRENQYGYFNRSIEITNSDGTHRSIDTNIVLGSDYFSVGKLRLGSDIDVIPKDSGTLYNDCSRYRLLKSSERGYTYRYLFVRSASYMSSYYGTNEVYHSGLNSIEVPANISAIENSSGRPRLCYKGNYTVSEEFQV